MKVGPHSGNSLDEIITMKLKEQAMTGSFYWGYSGSLCHPKRVHAFVEEADKIGSPVHLVFSPTISRYNPPKFEKATRFSVDERHWHRLPKFIRLWNCKYAFVASELNTLNAGIDLDDYVVASGDYRGTLLGRYLRGRLNKACAFFIEPRPNVVRKITRVSNLARLVPPYCVFLRR
jgi:hypothetical protein